MSATELADAFASGPGTGAAAIPNHLQVEGFSQPSRDEWSIMMEKSRSNARGAERTTIEDKYCYIKYLTAPKDPDMLRDEVKKRAWVIDNFYMDGQKLMRKPTVTFKTAREVKHEGELPDAIIQTHVSLCHVGQEVTVTAIVRE